MNPTGKVSVPYLVTYLNQIPIFEQCMDLRMDTQNKNKNVNERDWTTFSKSVKYIRFGIQHNSGNLHDLLRMKSSL